MPRKFVMLCNGSRPVGTEQIVALPPQPGVEMERAHCCIILLSFFSTEPSLAQDSQGYASFQHLSTPSAKKSLVDLAPGLLTFFNNGPVFGIPGTEVGSIWERTQLTGDWGGLRTDLARHGLFFDVYSTSTYQDVTSGGLKTGSSFVQNIQTSVNIDTARAVVVRRFDPCHRAIPLRQDSPRNTRRDRGSAGNTPA
jgi:hypothetical protein